MSIRSGVRIDERTRSSASVGRIVLLLLAAALSAACATYPAGPSVMALPGTTASFEQFQVDDTSCRAYADQASGGASAQSSAEQAGVDSAVVGTVAGAAAGALIGAATGNPAAGAGIGAGSGLLLGSAAGTDAYAVSGYRQQDRYDSAYVQCMYAKGHQVPVPASVAAAQGTQRVPAYTAPAPAARTAPAVAAYPPPGTPPPPGY